MIKLDDDLLVELGLMALPPDDKKRMLTHIYETLEMRVGMELAKQMTDAQLTDFEAFINRNDEAGALKWLETNFPNYKEVVAAEFEKLKAEIKQVAPQILQDALAAAQQMQAGQTMPQMPMQTQGQQGGAPPIPPQQAPQYAQPQPPSQGMPRQPSYGPAGAPASQQQPQYASPQPQPYYPQQPPAAGQSQQQVPTPGYYAPQQPAPSQGQPQPYAPYPPQQPPQQ